jgi:spermidine synthase
MTSRRYLPLLLVLFVGSGCAALIYEIVWFQLLQMVIGSSAISLGVLLGTFMGGMCVGSLALARLISPRHHPLRVYALLELGIGAFGILVLLLIPVIGQLYTAVGGQGLSGIFFRGALCAVCLLPPTLLMGATLPAISRWVQASTQGVSWLGFFYGGNTAGAVFGCLLAGFYLLRVHDMPTATYVAVAINAAVAAIGFGLSTFTVYETRKEATTGTPVPRAPGTTAVYVTIALSGLTALGAEVIWTRLLSLLLGGTTYTFSIILAVFLVGIGLGSSAGSYASRGITSPRLALGVSQLLLVAAIAWSAYAISSSLPYWPINAGLVSSPWFLFQLDLVRCLYTILPAACLWGASFPLALSAVATEGQDPGRMVGGVYAANTVGAIVGALAFSLVLIPGMGTQNSQRLLLGIAALAALLVLYPIARSPRAIMALAGAGAVAAFLGWTLSAVPFELIAYGRQFPWRVNSVTELYRGEGMNSSIAVSELKSDPDTRNFHVAGKIEASNEPQDMRLQRLLGNLPALLHPAPRSVLVVGFGAGVTAGSFVPFPDVKRIVICEIEPLIPKIVSTYFATENQNVFKDPRVEMIYDDARHFVRTTKEKFDIITSDPIHPWVKGAATLYTKEYFEQVKAHLNPGGVVTQWVPLYESNDAAVKSEIATFFEVFPHGTVWGNRYNGEGYDVVLLGTADPFTIDVDAIDARLARADHGGALLKLVDVGFRSATDVLATFGGSARDLAPWLKDAQINRDIDLRLQYLAGMSPDAYTSGAIYNQILSFRRFPDDLVVGTEAKRQALRAAIFGSP